MTAAVRRFARFILRGGCFWGIEELMRQVPGVAEATSGYANGLTTAAPRYEEVCSGTTGFCEAVRVRYDPARVSLSTLLFLFFRAIDPTDEGGQGGIAARSTGQGSIILTRSRQRSSVK